MQVGKNFSKRGCFDFLQVENLNEAVSEVITNSLCPAVEKILADGLLPQYTVWTVIQASATLGTVKIRVLPHPRYVTYFKITTNFCITPLRSKFLLKRLHML